MLRLELAHRRVHQIRAQTWPSIASAWVCKHELDMPAKRAGETRRRLDRCGLTSFNSVRHSHRDAGSVGKFAN